MVYMVQMRSMLCLRLEETAQRDSREKLSTLGGWPKEVLWLVSSSLRCPGRCLESISLWTMKRRSWHLWYSLLRTMNCCFHESTSRFRSSTLSSVLLLVFLPASLLRRSISSIFWLSRLLSRSFSTLSWSLLLLPPARSASRSRCFFSRAWCSLSISEVRRLTLFSKLTNLVSWEALECLSSVTASSSWPMQFRSCSFSLLFAFSFCSALSHSAFAHSYFACTSPECTTQPSRQFRFAWHFSSSSLFCFSFFFNCCTSSAYAFEQSCSQHFDVSQNALCSAWFTLYSFLFSSLLASISCSSLSFTSALSRICLSSWQVALFSFCMSSQFLVSRVEMRWRAKARSSWRVWDLEVVLSRSFLRVLSCQEWFCSLCCSFYWSWDSRWWYQASQSLRFLISAWYLCSVWRRQCLSLSYSQARWRSWRGLESWWRQLLSSRLSRSMCWACWWTARSSSACFWVSSTQVMRSGLLRSWLSSLVSCPSCLSSWCDRFFQKSVSSGAWEGS